MSSWSTCRPTREGSVPRVVVSKGRMLAVCVCHALRLAPLSRLTSRDDLRRFSDGDLEAKKAKLTEAIEGAEGELADQEEEHHRMLTKLQGAGARARE